MLVPKRHFTANHKHRGIGLVAVKWRARKKRDGFLEHGGIRRLGAHRGGRKNVEIGMKWNALEEEQCSVARTVAVIGDRWSLLILRDCFLRVRRFEDFQVRLGVTRHILADRLKKLVRHGVLRRAPYQTRPKRHEYILTQKGLDLYPIIMAIVHWGDVHMVDERGRPKLYQHKRCGKMFDPVMICSKCGEPLSAREVHVHVGPGASERDRPPAGEDLRAPDGAQG